MVQVLSEPICSRMTGVYGPKPFIPHAASLHQGFPHCEKFSTAATRRCLDRVSVPVWLVVLSDQLPVLALVSRYLTNKLIGRGLIKKRQALRSPTLDIKGCPSISTFGISSPFSELSPTSGRITHVLRTLTPLRLLNIATRQSASDLHVLSTPPAFVLSQNQTLRKQNVSLILPSGRVT